MKKNRIILAAGTACVIIALTIFSITGQKKEKEANTDIKALKTSELLVESDKELITENTEVKTTLSADTLAATDQDIINKEIQEAINQLIQKYYDVNSKLDDNILAEDQNKDKKTLKTVNQKREVIEAYKNVTTMIKAGLESDSYAVFTRYDIKFSNIDTLVPGMSMIYVKKDENGELRIDLKNEEAKEYMNQLADEDDIKKMIDEVNTELSKAVKADTSLAELMKYLKSENNE